MQSHVSCRADCSTLQAGQAFVLPGLGLAWSGAVSHITLYSCGHVKLRLLIVSAWCANRLCPSWYPRDDFSSRAAHAVALLQGDVEQYSPLYLVAAAVMHSQHASRPVKVAPNAA